MTTSATGEKLFAQRCSGCHDHATGNIPMRLTIERKSPEGVIATLTTGPMRPMATGLSASDIKDVAIYLTGRPLGLDPSPDANMCQRSAGSTRFGPSDWRTWGVDLKNTLYQPHSDFSAQDIRTLKVKWTFALPGGAAVAEPMLVGDRLFVTSSNGVFALDVATGCTLWHSSEGRAAKVVTAATLPNQPDTVFLYLGGEKAHVLALRADTGRLVWSTQVDEHPNARITGPVAAYEDALYVPVSSMEDPLAHDPAYPCCTFRGSVVALDAGSGKIRWKSHSIRPENKPLGTKTSAGAMLYGPAGGAIYAPLTIDQKRNAVYATTAESYHHDSTEGTNSVIAFDLATGRRLWVQQLRPKDNAAHCAHQDEEDACTNPGSALFEFAAPAVLADLPTGGQVLLAGQKSGVVYGLDPDSGGKLLWETRVSEGGSLGGVEHGFASVDGSVYVPISDSEVKAPYMPGGLVALDATNGATRWRVPGIRPVCTWGTYGCSAAQAASPAAVAGAIFSGAWDGHMRAYNMQDGKLLWDFDTGTAFAAVNGVKARGGAVEGYPIIVGHRAVYVVSGANSLTSIGNALVAFTPDGK